MVRTSLGNISNRKDRSWIHYPPSLRITCILVIVYTGIWM
jgi:hypothetical protein